MSTPAQQYVVEVLAREQLSEHLVRLTLGGAGLEAFASTGVPDEWVGLVVPGQFQSRYYTVRRVDGSDIHGGLVLDIVVHEVGLVTEWASRECVGEQVTITEPKATYAPPDDAEWLFLVGDLTAMPAMARIAESTSLPTRIWAEVPDDLPDYLASSAEVTWLPFPEEGSGLAAVVESMVWPDGPGYFWMAGESAQMRAIRKYLMRERRGTAYDVMGYWRAAAQRQPRAVDPGPIWRAGKAAGQSDEEIWAAYDAARETTGDRS